MLTLKMQNLKLILHKLCLSTIRISFCVNSDFRYQELQQTEAYLRSRVEELETLEMSLRESISELEQRSSVRERRMVEEINRYCWTFYEFRPIKNKIS